MNKSWGGGATPSTGVKVRPFGEKSYSQKYLFLHGLYLLCWYANLLVQIFEVKVPDILKINLYLINMKLLQPPNEN